MVVFSRFDPDFNILDLNDPNMEPLKQHLTKPHSTPQEVTIIYDKNRTPRLAIVTGVREFFDNLPPFTKLADVNYHEIVRVDDQDSQIFVQGSTGLHPWGQGNNESFDLISYTDFPSLITIEQNGPQLVIVPQRTQGL